MEEAHYFHGIGPTTTSTCDMAMRGMGKRGLEWDLNDWKWDGDLFIATHSTDSLPSNFIPLVPIPSSHTSSSSSEDTRPHPHPHPHSGSGITNHLDRKRRVVLVEEESSCFDANSNSLALKLGGGSQVGGWEGGGMSGKKTKLSGSTVNRAVCQVENCGADLTKAKDYHRRHKVCEMHSKATKALVANVMQRFCQQCSRFHVLQEFDEGKRSCRRRLAGHNKRRRKTQPDATSHSNSLNDDHTNSVLLISLLRLLSNMHANNKYKSDKASDQDLLVQLLQTLANPSGLHTEKDLTGILHESQKLLNKEIPRKVVNAVGTEGVELQAASSQGQEHMFPMKDSPPAYSENIARGMKMNNFDLNDVYVDSDDGTEELERSPANGNYVTSLDFPAWARPDSHQSSPPQISGNSDSASAQSPSSSSGEAQSRTDRIVFKLFGKEPSDFPIVLRGQILDWLAHSPTDIESYIRPGCIILTIYLRLADSLWEELCSNLSSCLARLFDISNDTFWRTGWLFVRVQNQIAFVHNGQVVLDMSFPVQNIGRIMNVAPIAVGVAELAHFRIRGSNLSRCTTRLLCALEGTYLDHEAIQGLEDADCLEEDDRTEYASFSCSMPNASGRGFIEVEDNGFSSSFFPFIIAEKDVCSEIRTLEDILESEDNDDDDDDDAYEMNGRYEARNQALDFLNEMGWLLHRSCLKSRLQHLDPNSTIFSFRRFQWLMDFAMDRDWCAVVKKLLDNLVAGIVGLGEHPSLEVAVSEMGLLHRAVRRNCKSMVEFLLRYTPLNASECFESTTEGSHRNFMFRPDVQGPAGLTPLHVAAGRDGSEDILDALTDDPRQIGIEAWKKAHDSTGASPEDYARLRGHYTYIHLVQRKINQKPVSGHVVLDIRRDRFSVDALPEQEISKTFEIGRSGSLAVKKSCRICDQKMAYYGPGKASLVYRPAMVSLVAIAAVCVCMALMFRGLPKVVYLFRPFRWESLGYGSS